MLSVTANDSKGLDTDFKRPVLALNTMPVAQTISGTSASSRHAQSKFVPLSAADATLGKVFSLGTRQQKHYEEAMQQQRVEVLPHLVLASVPVTVIFLTEGFFYHFKMNLLGFSVHNRI